MYTTVLARLLQEREAEARQLAASLDEEAGAREGDHLRAQRALHDLERQLRASQVPPRAATLHPRPCQALRWVRSVHSVCQRRACGLSKGDLAAFVEVTLCASTAVACCGDALCRGGASLGVA